MLKVVKLESGDCIVIHPDVMGHLSGWIDSLYRASKDLPNFGVLSALILDVNHKIHFNGGYITPNIYAPLGYGMGEEYLGQFPGTREVEVVPFYCALISKDLIEKQGLSEVLGTSIFEDANYCMEAKSNGFKIYTTDKLTVIYQGGPKNAQEIKNFALGFTDQAESFKQRWGNKIAESYKYPTLYCAKAGGPSGFARAARGYIRGLSDNGVKVFFEPLETVLDSVVATPDEKINAIMSERGDMYMPQIIWGQAPYFIKNSGMYKIGHCEFEATEAPEIWTRYCNMMDEIWVPTEWDRKKFVKAGVNVPIYVIHQGIDPNYFHPNYAPMTMDAKEKFKFIVNAAWFPRKNLHNLAVAFQSEFRQGEDVCLIIKTMNLGLNEGIENEVKKIPEDKGAANIYVKEDELPDYKMPSLYTACDCFVLPTHGEGWGLPIFEALACGLPVITTGYGAPFETLKNDKGEVYPGVHFVDYTETQATDPYVYMEYKNWAEPNRAQFAQKMRYVYENAQAEKAKALKTSEIIRDRFSWTNVCKPIVGRLKDIYENKLTQNA